MYCSVYKVAGRTRAHTQEGYFVRCKRTCKEKSRGKKGGYSCFLSPHIIVVVVELGVVAKRRVPVLMMSWSIYISVLIALLATPRLCPVLVMRIIMIIIHLMVVIGAAIAILLLLLCLWEKTVGQRCFLMGCQ